MEISKEELDQIIKDAIAESEDEKWNGIKFMKGWINHKFLAFVTFTVISTVMIFKKILSIDSKERITILIIWGVVTVVFILGKAIDNAIYNAKITAEFKAGAQANINTDTAKVIEAVKNIKTGVEK